MSKIALAFILVVGIAVVGGYFYRLSQQGVAIDQSVVPPAASPTPTVQPESFLQTKPDTNLLQAGGSSYSDPQGVFGFLYPNDYTIDSQEEGKYVRVFKKGPTQKGQTEMYDGVIIVFERVDLAGSSLSEWVDTQIARSLEGGSEIIQPKKAVTLHGYAGFTYEVRGLGTSTLLLVQKDVSSPFAISISSLVADPNQHGFQQEVEQILATLKLDT